MDFLAALEAEIAGLERQLAASPLYVKLRRAQELRDAYAVTDVKSQAISALPQEPTKSAVRSGGTRPFASGTSAAIIDAVKEHLRAQAHPVKTRDLMDVLAAEGIEVGGTVPQNSVSSMLSKSLDIVSHGRAGWTLAETDKAGDDAPQKDASPAFDRPQSSPVEPGQEVAHDIDALFR